MCKFVLDSDHPEPMVVAVDQVNSRFVDETMLGNYEYPAVRLILTKVIDKYEAETQQTLIKQKYLHGCRDADTHVALPLEQGLKAGTYLLMYSAEFTEEYIERKLVVSCYCSRDVMLERVQVEDYHIDNFNTMDNALYNAVMAEQDIDEDDY